MMVADSVFGCFQDKTFGLKNKKGAKQQKYIKNVTQQVKYGQQSARQVRHISVLVVPFLNICCFDSWHVNYYIFWLRCFLMTRCGYATFFTVMKMSPIGNEDILTC